MIVESLRTSLCDNSLRRLATNELKSSVCRLLAAIFHFEWKLSRTPGNIFHLFKGTVHVQIFSYLVKCIPDETHDGE